ncbi:DUF2218 domain-containing protein [Corynebacterium pilosum]|uniref:Uncharacterized protein conserved in bacteria (DUF2218) n=1 Tax=Corynebacterium pilosum TaxID=35756 RepID=A0A376CNN1_9CORY|nr:DUF2218 domain-containing protein [Corynebacterium pilosum]STC70126.1 Uncharacterized protein conserved in bacteria (DUF2218) [Corynebacterium pilosum]
MTELLTSTARVQTDRAARYGKQLASHFSRKLNTHWDSDAARGSLEFPGEGVEGKPTQVDLIASDDVLMMNITADEETVERLERVVAVHLIRFGMKDNLEVTWTRKGGEEHRYTAADLEQ